MRHAILGAGGVGGLIGAALAKSGDDVTLVLRPKALGTYPETLSLQSPFGNFSVPVKRVREVTEPYDVMWVTVKATHLDEALQQAGNGKNIGAIVPLLNGLDHVPLLRARFGDDRVVPATIGVESERVAAGQILQSSPSARLSVASMGESRMGSTLEKLRKFGFVCQFVADERKMLWSKLAFLAPCALVTTASGMPMGQVNAHPEWRKRADDCVREACLASAAVGTPLDPAAFIRFFDSMPAGARSSMQKDFAGGHPLELDAIAGPILRIARDHHLDAHVTSELVRIISGKAGAVSHI